MKRIQMVLVLLVAVSIVSVAGQVSCAYADDGGAILVPQNLIRSESLSATTDGVPPDGDGTEGDPDSMGDGLSKDINSAGASANGLGWNDDAEVISGLEESLLYIMSQIQLLVL